MNEQQPLMRKHSGVVQVGNGKIRPFTRMMVNRGWHKEFKGGGQKSLSLDFVTGPDTPTVTVVMEDLEVLDLLGQILEHYNGQDLIVNANLIRQARRIFRLGPEWGWADDQVRD